MQIKSGIFRTALAMFLLVGAQGVHALSLTKDTVFESTFPQPQDSWATWHDSVSLINTTSDTAKIESMHFVVPEGKAAHLEFGFRKPYKRTGNVDGIVIRSGQPYVIASNQDKSVPPGGRVSITGFRIQECIACPVVQGSANGNSEDALAMLLIFNSGSARDTLVIRGTIDDTPSATIRKPSPRQGRFKSNDRIEGSRFFNILGRFRHSVSKFSDK